MSVKASAYKRLAKFAQGGGGFGNPLLRDPERVRADVVRGLVTVEAAERAYGVVLRDGAVDEAATVQRRAALAAERPAETGEYTLGPAREAYDRAWPGEARETLNALITAFPLSMRAVAREEIKKVLEPGSNL